MYCGYLELTENHTAYKLRKTNEAAGDGQKLLLVIHYTNSSVKTLSEPSN